VPSWKVTSSRRVKVYASAVSLTSQAVARAGTNSPAAGWYTNVSNTVLATRSESENVVIFGSRVSIRFASE
jgi:hypothetical protein